MITAQNFDWHTGLYKIKDWNACTLYCERFSYRVCAVVHTSQAQLQWTEEIRQLGIQSLQKKLPVSELRNVMDKRQPRVTALRDVTISFCDCIGVWWIIQPKAVIRFSCVYCVFFFFCTILRSWGDTFSLSNTWLNQHTTRLYSSWSTKRINYLLHHNIESSKDKNGVRGAAVGWGTALQVGSSRVRFPIVSRIFYWHNPSGRTVALGSTQPLAEMSTRNTSWGVKAAGA
jgi:hypothetical protein